MKIEVKVFNDKGELVGEWHAMNARISPSNVICVTMSNGITFTTDSDGNTFVWQPVEVSHESPKL